MDHGWGCQKLRHSRSTENGGLPSNASLASSSHQLGRPPKHMESYVVARCCCERVLGLFGLPWPTQAPEVTLSVIVPAYNEVASDVSFQTPRC